ncbi:MAG: radical SAM protein [Thiothrix sp.]|uniref:radical SAM protein n=1 Tax=Thiothrix sp. TaxID=1032 RepID=UPI0026339E67|nr:radical SAM protein [Thiothrix sp.]MDD5392728.1 radical SAM protein [Thiothrix sp.]
MALKIRFLLTSRCTATCAYCHNEGQDKQGASLLHLHTVTSILDKLAAANIVPAEIILSGGEPTLHKQVGEIARQCKATGTHVSMDSHAGHPQLLQAALPYLDELKMHIDSFDPATQQASMGISIHNVLGSIRLAQQFPVQLRVNHPLRDVQETAEFVKRTRELGVDCKVIEMFGDDTCTANLRTVNWEKLGYSRQACGDWLHTDGAHRVFHKRCGAEHNQHDNALFIGADGVRRALDSDVIGTADNFHVDMLQGVNA